MNTRLVRRAAMLLALAFAGQVAAQTCDPRWPQVQFVQDNLQRISTEGDMPTARDYADRSRRQLDHLAGLATRCSCPAAAQKFAEAAALAVRAQDIDARKAMRELVAQVRPPFEAAQAALRDCARR